MRQNIGEWSYCNDKQKQGLKSSLQRCNIICKNGRCVPYNQILKMGNTKTESVMIL